MNLRGLFSGRATLRRVLFNSTWLAADNLFRLGVSFLVGAWVARHLGPEKFGLLNHAIAFCAPFSALVSLGLNGIVVRDLVREPETAGELLGSAAALKLVAGGAAFLVCMAVLVIVPNLDVRSRVLILLTIAGTVLQAVDVFDLWFQSQGQVWISAWVRSGSSLIINVVKVAMILTDAALPWFAAAAGMELLICGSGWAMVFWKSSGLARWRVSLARCGMLLRECWMVALAGIAVQIQAYFDQVLLASMRDATEVGQYAAALRLVSVFAFIPVAVSTAASPEITRSFLSERAGYFRRLCHLYRVLFAAFVVVWVPLALFSHPIVHLLFGTSYAVAAGLLPLLAWRLLLANLGVVRGIFLTNEKMLRHAMVTAVVAAALNLGLNAVLIPRWGATGCIIASLVSFTVNTVVLEFLDPRARTNLRVMLWAVTFRPLQI